MGEIEFFVPDPKDQESETPKSEAAPAPAADPPTLEVELPKKPEPSRNELRMAAREIEDPDDPMVLLQRELSRLPGRHGAKAADMAFNTDLALNNLGVTAKRMHDLEQRKLRRNKRGK